MLKLFNSGSGGVSYSAVTLTKDGAEVTLRVSGDKVSARSVILNAVQLQKFFDECVSVGLVKVPASVPASALLIEGSL